MSDESQILDGVRSAALDTLALWLKSAHTVTSPGSRPPHAPESGGPEASALPYFGFVNLLVGNYNTYLRFQSTYLQYQAQYLHGISAVLRQWNPGAGAAPRGLRETMHLSARVGEVASASFRLTNESACEVRPAFFASEFEQRGTTTRFVPRLDVAPEAGGDAAQPTPSLRAGERRSFRLAVHLDPPHFRPGESYRGRLLVRDNDRPIVELGIDVTIRE